MLSFKTQLYILVVFVIVIFCSKFCYTTFKKIINQPERPISNEELQSFNLFTEPNVDEPEEVLNVDPADNANSDKHNEATEQHDEAANEHDEVTEQHTDANQTPKRRPRRTTPEIINFTLPEDESDEITTNN